MATFSGFIVPVGYGGPVANLTSSWSPVRPIPTSVISLRQQVQTTGGALNRSAQPIAIRQESKSGEYQKSFFDDFYNRIHFFPQTIDFGTITDDTTLPISIWNSYLSNVTITELEVQQGLGIVLGEQSVGRMMRPLQILTFPLIAQFAGPSSIGATFIFGFSTGFHFALKIRGTRGRIFEFDPNWRDSYKLTYEFRTDIITSRSGREQRRALRNHPRRYVDYTATATGAGLRRLNRLLSFAHVRTFVIPDFTRQTTLAEPIAIGVSAIRLTSVPVDLSTGGSLLLETGTERRTIDVEAISGDLVTIKNEADFIAPAGSKVYMPLYGKFEPSISSARYSTDVAEIAFRMKVDTGIEPYFSTGTAYPIFNGREVFVLKPNWSSNVDETFDHTIDYVDYGYGVVTQIVPTDFETRKRSATFVRRSRQEIDEIVRFFWRMRGQQGEFYMPTWESDLTLAQRIAANSATMKILGVDESIYSVSTVHKVFALILKSGAIHFNKVSSMYVDSDNLNITVAHTWPIDFELADVHMICWVPVWRLSSDILTIEMFNDSVAQVKLAMQTLEDL